MSNTPFKTKKTVIFLALSAVFLSSCTVAPGLRTDDLPPSGLIKSDNGMDISVEPISADSVEQTKENTSPALTSDLAKITPLFQQQQSIYTLGTGDVLGITLWAYPEITPPVTSTANNVQASGFTVDQKGFIHFPLVGLIQVKGKTVEQVTNALSKALSHYLKQPDVQVRVLSYASRKFFVGGQVNLAGEYALTDQPLSAYGAIGKANGITPTGDIQQITLTRKGVSYPLNFTQLEKSGYSVNNLYMQDGDSLYINSKENRDIYVLGEAGSNKPIPLREQGMNLADVIGEGMGVNPTTSNPARIYVIRTDNKDNLTHVYHLDLTQIANFGLAQKFHMQTNDVVYIDPTGLTRWSRIVSQIVPSATTFNVVKAATN